MCKMGFVSMIGSAGICSRCSRVRFIAQAGMPAQVVVCGW